MKNILYILLILVCVNCNKKEALNESLEFNKVNVYYVPFHLSSPVGSKADDIKKGKSISITNRDVLNQIKEKLLNIEKLQSDYEFADTSVHLLCDFYNEEEKVLTLSNDTNHFLINQEIYIGNQDLISLLIKDFEVKK